METSAELSEDSFFKVYESIPDKNKPLYHYTSAAGLYGMLRNRCLWLTDLNYLNDANEGKIVIDIIKEVLHSYGKFTIDDEVLLNSLGSSYSFSLTEEKDLLSQWRGYCPNGGYCVSFDLCQLDYFMKDNRLFVGKCVYDREQQKKFVIENILSRVSIKKLEEGISEWDEIGKGGISSIITVQNLIVEAVRRHRGALALFKDGSFEEEKEWRIVSIGGPHSNYHNTARYNIDFRTSSNRIIPYKQYNFTKKTSGEMLYGIYPLDFERILDGVIVSPSYYSELEITACRQLLDKYNYGTFSNITSIGNHTTCYPTKSRIPYRP